MPESLFQKILLLRLHLPVTASLISFASAYVLGCGISIQTLSVVFLLCTIIYGFNRIADPKEDSTNSPEGFAWISSKRRLILLFEVGLPLLLLLASLIHLGMPSALWISVLLILGLSYSKAPFIGKLKKFPLIKSLLPSTIWAATTVLVPTLIEGNLHPSATLIFLFSYILGTTLEVETLWDYRDLRGDSAAGLKTLPTLLSQKSLEKILIAINLALCFLILFLVGSGQIAALFSSFLIHRLLIFYFSRKFLRLPMEAARIRQSHSRRQSRNFFNSAIFNLLLI